MTIITTTEELSRFIGEQFEKNLPAAIEKATRLNPEKLFTISETARKLGKSYTTIQRMIYQNRIKTTADQKYISQQAITNYLTGQK